MSLFHCFGEQIGLEHDDAICCWNQTPEAPAPQHSCRICEAVNITGHSPKQQYNPLELAAFKADDSLALLLKKPVLTPVKGVAPTTPDDGVLIASRCEEVWRSKALPVRGPSLIMA